MNRFDRVLPLSDQQWTHLCNGPNGYLREKWVYTYPAPASPGGAVGAVNECASVPLMNETHYHRQKQHQQHQQQHSGGGGGSGDDGGGGGGGGLSVFSVGRLGGIGNVTSDYAIEAMFDAAKVSLNLVLQVSA